MDFHSGITCCFYSTFTYFSSACQEKQEDLHWLLRCVLRTISLCQDTGKLFAFLPEFYIESAIYLFQALWNYFMPLTSSGSVQGTLFLSIWFLSSTGTFLFSSCLISSLRWILLTTDFALEFTSVHIVNIAPFSQSEELVAHRFPLSRLLEHFLWTFHPGLWAVWELWTPYIHCKTMLLDAHTNILSQSSV